MALSPFHWQPRTLAFRASQPWIFGLLTVTSLVMHGLLLGLPLPSSEEGDGGSAPPPQEATAAVEVAVLPKGFRRSEPETAATAAPPPQPAEKTEAVARSQSDPLPTADERALPPAQPTVQDAAPQLPTPSIDPPPRSPVPPLPDPLNDLPIESGTTPLTENDPPPTLDDRLQDPQAYQFDGKQVLDFGAVSTKLLDWVTAGQALPSKVDPLEVPYLLANRCLAAPPVSGVMVVVLDTDDTILQGPEVISSTGYAILDEKAKEDVRTGKYTFPERDQAKAYSLEITVPYPADCPE